MNWNELLFTVVASAGGTGALIWFISKSIATSAFERYMEKVKHTYDLELSEIQSKLNSKTHITNVQYEKEFEIYQNIWASMYECIIATNALYPQGIENQPINEDEKEKYNLNKYDKFADTYNEFVKYLIKNEPLLEDDIYTKFEELRVILSKVGAIFKYENFDKKCNVSYTLVKDKPMSNEDYKFVYIESHDRIEEKRKEIKDLIKNYLISLRNGIT